MAAASRLPFDFDFAGAAWAEVAAALGRVDTLVNSAAIYPRKPILEITDADWDASNAVNVKGTYHMMVAAIRQMKDQAVTGPVRGRIVNITSVDAFKAHPQNAHYAATKAAVVSLTRSMAQEVAPDGILVNVGRGSVVDEAALVAALQAGRIRAGIDVFDEEPLPADHPLRATPNTVLTPHLGYVAEPVFKVFYGDSVENITAFLDGKPIRMMNPEAWKG